MRASSQHLWHLPVTDRHRTKRLQRLGEKDKGLRLSRLIPEGWRMSFSLFTAQSERKYYLESFSHFCKNVIVYGVTNSFDCSLSASSGSHMYVTSFRCRISCYCHSHSPPWTFMPNNYLLVCHGCWASIGAQISLAQKQTIMVVPHEICFVFSQIPFFPFKFLGIPFLHLLQ